MHNNDLGNSGYANWNLSHSGSVTTNTKTKLGYFTFNRTGKYIIVVTIRWATTYTSKVYSECLINGNPNSLDYAVHQYPDSIIQFGVSDTFCQTLITIKDVTSTSAQMSSWIYHNNGSDCNISAHWETAYFLH